MRRKAPSVLGATGAEGRRRKASGTLGSARVSLRANRGVQGWQSERHGRGRARLSKDRGGFVSGRGSRGNRGGSRRGCGACSAARVRPLRGSLRSDSEQGAGSLCSVGCGASLFRRAASKRGSHAGDPRL